MRQLQTMNSSLISLSYRLGLSLGVLLLAIGYSRAPNSPSRESDELPVVNIPSEVLQRHRSEFEISTEKGKGVLLEINHPKDSAGKQVATEFVIVGGLNTGTVTITQKGFNALGIRILQGPDPDNKLKLGTSRNGVNAWASSIPIIGWNDTGKWQPLLGKSNLRGHWGEIISERVNDNETPLSRI